MYILYLKTYLPTYDAHAREAFHHWAIPGFTSYTSFKKFWALKHLIFVTKWPSLPWFSHSDQTQHTARWRALLVHYSDGGQVKTIPFHKAVAALIITLILKSFHTDSKTLRQAHPIFLCPTLPVNCELTGNLMSSSLAKVKIIAYKNANDQISCSNL